MRPRVIDTNVGITSNGRAEQANPDCVSACIRVLREVQHSGPVLIDDDYRILNEYKPYFSYSGQPGPGDRFYRWLMLNLANPKRCLQIHISPTWDDPTDFDEFPNDPKLSGFDPSDRKFVAVACASGLNAIIVNASDTDWWHFREVLSAHGVHVEFICPQLIE